MQMIAACSSSGETGTDTAKPEDEMSQSLVFGALF